MKTMTRREYLATLLAVDRYEPSTPEEEAALLVGFPNVEPGVRPYGQRVLVQIRYARRRTASGIEIPHETQDTEKWNTGIAQVLMLGPLAFKKRDTLQPWGEGAWVEVGDYVRAPRFGGDRWEVPLPDTEVIDARKAELAKLEAELAALDRVKDREGAVEMRLLQRRKGLQSEPPPMLIQFAMFNDFELIGEVLSNPVEMRVYV
jgi:co-chaperonin GroES (HSP10)